MHHERNACFTADLHHGLCIIKRFGKGLLADCWHLVGGGKLHQSTMA